MWKWLYRRIGCRLPALRRLNRMARSRLWRQLGGRPASLRIPIHPSPAGFPDFREWSSSEAQLEKKNRSRP